MTNPLFETIDKAPFSGKFAIHDSVRSLVEATPEKALSPYIRANLLLGGMAVAHAFQTYLGASMLAAHVDRFIDGSNPVDLMLAGVDGVYATVNAAVTARQLAHIPRMTQVYKKKQARSSELADVSGSLNTNKKARREHSPPKGYGKSLAIATATTLAGQALFLGTVYHSHSALDAPQTAVIESGNSTYGPENLDLDTGKVQIDLSIDSESH